MIDTNGMTPNEIRLAGIKVLNRELGPDGYIQFMQQFSNGSGDYTKEREKLFAGETVKSILNKVVDFRESKN